MLILSHGMVKSASTFAFQMARDILYATGMNQFEIKKTYLPDHVWSDGRGVESAHNFVNLSSVSLREIAHRLPDESHLILKTHDGPTQEALDMLDAREIVVFSTHRSSEAAAMGLQRMAQLELAKPWVLQRFTVHSDPVSANSAAEQSAKTSIDWIEFGGALSIKFEDLVGHPKDVAYKIAKLIDSDCDIDSIVEYYESDKSRIQEYTGIPREKDDFGAGYRFPQDDFPEGYWIENLMHLAGAATSETIVREAREHLSKRGFSNGDIDGMHQEGLRRWGLVSS